MKLLYAGLSAVAPLALIAWLEREQTPLFQVVTTDGLSSLCAVLLSQPTQAIERAVLSHSASVTRCVDRCVNIACKPVTADTPDRIRVRTARLSETLGLRGHRSVRVLNPQRDRPRERY